MEHPHKRVLPLTQTKTAAAASGTHTEVKCPACGSLERQQSCRRRPEQTEEYGWQRETLE